jgi:L-ascorbate metabolism protein UlaG (beta-lactamase superfamily)
MKGGSYSGPISDHFDGKRFFNPGQPSTDRSVGEMWRWKLAGVAVPWPKKIEVKPALPIPRSERLRITMVGHATLLIQVSGLNILTDPVWSDRASPLSFAGPERVTIPGIAFDDLPAIDLVLVSHNHYDHLDIPTLRRLHAVYRPRLITPIGNDLILRASIPEAEVVTGDWGDRIAAGAAAAITLTRANHWSRRRLTDRRMALWSGFLIETRRATIWFAGDTGYGDGSIFRDLRTRHGPPDVALIPIGAYEPRWFMAAQHVNPKEAVRVFQDTGARRALGIHWGTFKLTDEGRDAPKEELLAALSHAGIDAARFVAAEPGHVFDFEDADPTPASDEEQRSGAAPIADCGR